MASPAFEPVQGNTYAIFVLGGTYDELQVVFDKLAEGAEKERFQDLHDMPFGTYGQFYDKYGIQWIFKGMKKQSRTFDLMMQAIPPLSSCIWKMYDVLTSVLTLVAQKRGRKCRQ